MAEIWSKDEEARRLAERFGAVRNRAAWAREHRLKGGGSMINQHIYGHRPIGIDAALIYANGFGVPLEEISPRLAREQFKRLQTPWSAYQLIPADARLGEPAPVFRIPGEPVRQALKILRDAVREAAPRHQKDIRLQFAALIEDVKSDMAIHKLVDLLCDGD